MKLRVLLAGVVLSGSIISPAPALGAEKSPPCLSGSCVMIDRADRSGFRPSITRNATILHDRRCMRKAKTICVDKGARAIYAVQNHHVVRAYRARFGARATPTREGVFAVYWKDADHVSGMFGSAMPYSMFFSGGEALHYSADFAARGYRGASHGCVNMRSRKGARWLYRWTPVGTRVLVTT